MNFHKMQATSLHSFLLSYNPNLLFWKISSVSQTTLEQVFLKLAKEKAEGAKVDVVVV